MPHRSAIQIRDPFVLPVPAEGCYYLYGTTDANAWSGPGQGFDAYRSRDLEEWEGPLPAFRPPAGFWGTDNFWAPEVVAWQGGYVMFASFIAAGRPRGIQVLHATSPAGPFVPYSDGPITPPTWECLDGTLHVDAQGTPWMVFCHEWVQTADGEMCLVQLSPDLRQTVGTPTLLFCASAATWAAPYASHGRAANYVTDGPYLHRFADGRLGMLWSTNGHAGYTMGLAFSTSGTIRGPWQQAPAPIFAKDGGHGMLVRRFDGQLLITLHHPNRTPHERPFFLRVAETAAGLQVLDPLPA